MTDGAGELTVWILAGGAAALVAAFVFILTTHVYKHAICWRYLFGGWKAIVPIVSAMPAAVGVFLLIVVFAIMDGFVLETREMTRGTLADIIVDADLGGMPHYDEFVRRVEALEGVAQATPLIQTYAILRIKAPEEAAKPVVRTCLLLGVHPEEKAEMGRFLQYLERRRHALEEGYPVADPSDLFEVPPRVRTRREAEGRPLRPGCIAGLGLVGRPEPVHEMEQAPKALKTRVALWSATLVGAVVALAVWRAARRRPGRTGWRVAVGAALVVLTGLVGTVVAVEVSVSGETETFLRRTVQDIPIIEYGEDLTVATIPVRTSGAVETAAGGVPKVNARAVTLLDTLKSRYWEVDSTHLYVDFETAQEMAGMNATGDVPARVHQVQVKLTDPARAEELVPRITRAWYALVAEKRMAEFPMVAVNTWQTKQRMILGVVEMERNITALMLGVMFLGFAVLTSLISYVMAFIKSRDIGIMKALGASDPGVGSLFLGYGFVIGLLGTAAGLAAALAMIHWLDPIELYVNQMIGREVFPRTVYYFERIPRHLSATWAAGVCLAVLALSTLASAAGGLLAAMKQPVETLRYE